MILTNGAIGVCYKKLNNTGSVQLYAIAQNDGLSYSLRVHLLF